MSQPNLYQFQRFLLRVHATATLQAARAPEARDELSSF